MENHKIDNEQSSAKERLSSDKLKSWKSLLVGSRAQQFDALLDKAPNRNELNALALEFNKPEIKNIVFDLDGTLVPPYADIPQEVITQLQEYLENEQKISIYTNSPHSERLNILRDAGVNIAATGYGKPSLKGFEVLCDEEQYDPQKTAMVGNFAATDMPLVEEGKDPHFAMNLLVKSIPPEREKISSLQKYIRAQIFHIIAVGAEKVVTLRNPEIPHR